MPLPKVPAPPVDYVAYQVLGGDWWLLEPHLETLIEETVDIRLGYLGADPYFEMGGVLVEAEVSGKDEDDPFNEGKNEELALRIGGEHPIVVRSCDMLDGQFALGYVAFLLRGGLYLSVSQYQRLDLGGRDV